MTETYFALRSADRGLAEGGNDPIRSMREEGGDVRIVLGAPVQHLSLLKTSRFDASVAIDWRGLLIAEGVWPALQPLLEKDLSAIRHAEVWLQVEGKRHPVDPRPYRFVEVRADVCDTIDLSLSRFDIFDAWEVNWLRTGLAEPLTDYPTDDLLFKERIERKRTAMRVETADELRTLVREAQNELQMVRPNPLRFRGRSPHIFLWSNEFIVDSQVAAEIRHSALDGVTLEPAIIGT